MDVVRAKSDPERFAFLFYKDIPFYFLKILLICPPKDFLDILVDNFIRRLFGSLVLDILVLLILLRE